MLEPILVVAIVIACTAWFVRHRWRRRLRALAELEAARRDSTGLQVLAKRYANGELRRDEYLQMRDDILEYAGSEAP